MYTFCPMPKSPQSTSVFVFTPPPLLKWSLALEMETMARLAWRGPVEGRCEGGTLTPPLSR